MMFYVNGPAALLFLMHISGTIQATTYCNGTSRYRHFRDKASSRHDLICKQACSSRTSKCNSMGDFICREGYLEADLPGGNNNVGDVPFRQSCLDQKCSTGLACRPRTKLCVRTCPAYGPSMTSYQGMSITDYNNKELYKMSLDMCTLACMQETAFSCTSIDYKVMPLMISSVCYLSNVTYLDVPVSARGSGDYGWVHATRNCVD